MPVVASAGFLGRVLASGAPTAGVLGQLVAEQHRLSGATSRQVMESTSGPSLSYSISVVLGGETVPEAELLGPFEVEESIDSVVALFSFGVAGRKWSVELTTQTWARTPVEVWATSGPIGRTRTWLRAFGVVVGCEQSSGPEPTLKVRCADPSIVYADLQLCEEIPAGAGLTRGTICRQIIEALGLEPDVPAGAVFRKAVVTDSRRIWEWLRDFGEPERWGWRFRDFGSVKTYSLALREAPEPPDDVWTLDDVVSIETTPPSQAPSQLIVRSTELVDAGDDLEIKRTRTEVKGLYARRQAVSLQLPDGSIVAAGGTPPAESLQTISVSEAEEQSRAGKLVTQITREWGWYNPRGAKLLSLGDPPGTVEDGYYWAETWIDEEGHYRAWRQEGWVQTGERREVPSYDADGTEIGRRTETYRWYSRPMATRHVGESAPTVPGAGVGDDGVSWQIFADVRIEQFGLAQVDEVQRTFDEESGAQLTEAQQTTAWYSARTAVADVPWYLNYSGAGQRDLLAPFQIIGRRTTANLITDGHLTGTVETLQGFAAPSRIGGPYDFGDGRSNVQSEALTITGVKTTAFNVLDQDSYEEVVDSGEGAQRRLVMGRAPRPRYKDSVWTQAVQAPIEVAVEDTTVEAWWGRSSEVITVDAAQSADEALTVAQWRQSRKLAYVHSVVRPVCAIRPGQTVLLLDPRSGISHRCLVAKLSERWILGPRPQILATYTLEQPL